VPGPTTKAQTRVLTLLGEWEQHVRRSVGELTTDVDGAVADVRAGLGVDTVFAGLARSVATRAGRDLALFVEGQFDAALVSIDLFDEMTAAWREVRRGG
jgi:hypothetical protein